MSVFVLDATAMFFLECGEETHTQARVACTNSVFVAVVIKVLEVGLVKYFVDNYQSTEISMPESRH